MSGILRSAQIKYLKHIRSYESTLAAHHTISPTREINASRRLYSFLRGNGVRAWFSCT